MLAKKNRLILGGRDPQKFSQKITSSDFILKYQKVEGETKAAITVSKKVAKKAVDRNRIKRVLSEVINSTGLKNLHFLIIVKNNIATLKTQEVEEKLTKLLKRI
ncbi:MAG TPA: ribonuclease P protein component [Candidatus Saccharimonadales bacterium]|nr:ribonuclease P protein component [Candidatus Saccharimonadales bacterium]